MKERLQKILSRAGVASRRAAEALMIEGRVTVDGEVVTELGRTADIETQDIRVDGARVRARSSRSYYAVHKPVGYITTRSDPAQRKTIMELLPFHLQSLFPVGRLDMASSGLLVLTDDGELAQRLTHPSFGVPKTYLVTVMGIVEPNVVTRATRGIVVDGERLIVDQVRVLRTRSARERNVAKPRTRLRVTLRQGRNREIRRLFGALGHPVIELHREQIGTLSVGGLAPGAFRRLTPREIAELQRASPPPRARRTRGK